MKRQLKGFSLMSKNHSAVELHHVLPDQLVACSDLQQVDGNEGPTQPYGLKILC